MKKPGTFPPAEPGMTTTLKSFPIDDGRLTTQAIFIQFVLFLISNRGLKILLNPQLKIRNQKSPT